MDVALLPDGSFGIIAEYVAGKVSFSSLIGQEPERIDELMKIYATAAKKLWECFARAYFDSDETPAIEEKIKPYGAISINLMLNTLPNTGFILNNKDFILSAVK